MACLIELIYGSGLRVSEALSLKKSIATAKSALIPVRGKGEKERLAPLSGPARAAISAFRALLDHGLAGRGRQPLAVSRRERERAHMTPFRPSRATSRASPRRRGLQRLG